MTKRILICANNYPPHFVGGAELIAHHQAKAIQAAGHTVAAFVGDGVTPGDRHSMWLDEYDGLPVYRVILQPRDYDNRYRNFDHPAVDRRFEEALELFRPDVVHFHNLVGLSTGLVPIAKHRGLRTVLTLHDHWGFCFKNTILRNDESLCTDFTNCAVCRDAFTDDSGMPFPIVLRNQFVRANLDAVDYFVSPSEYLARAYVRADFRLKK